MNWRATSPAFSAAKPSLIFSSGITALTNSSSLSFPLKYHSTYCGMSTRNRFEPMFEPWSFFSRSSWKPSISTVSPSGIMPMTVAVPPLRSMLNACCAVAASPMASNEWSTPPPVSSSTASTASFSDASTTSVAPKLRAISSFAEQLLVHENMLVKIRPDMPLDKAALIGCGVTTGVGAVINTAKVRPGETVAVIGCGGIGLNAIQAAAIVGAGRIIAVDRIASKRDLALAFGATDVVDASTVDAVGAVVELTGGGADHAFEAIGLSATAQQAFNMLAKGGTATVIGMIPLGDKVEVDGFQFLMEKRIQGSNMGSNRFRIDMPQYIEWYLAGKLKLDELVSGVMPLEKINDGFAALKGGEVARQLITFD